jgi:hypothetical protein
MVMQYHWGHGVGHTYAHHTITVPDVINKPYTEMEHEENQDSNSPDTTAHDIAAKQLLTLSDIDEGDDDDGSSDDDEYLDEDDDLDDSDDDQSEEFDLSQKGSDNELQVED